MRRTTNRRSRALAGAGVVTAFMLMMACGGAPANEASETGAPPRAGTVPDEDFLLLAEDELVRRCMEKAGFQFRSSPPDQISADPEGKYQWGRDDVSAAQDQGYGLSRQGMDEEADPNLEYLESLTPTERERWDLAFSGHWENRITFKLPNGTEFSISGDGCLAEARRQIYGDLRKYMQLNVALMQIAPDVDRLVAADPAYNEALASWRRCMNEKGYDFENPGDAVGAAAALYESELDPASAKAGEVRIAVADAQCGVESGVVRVATRLEEKYTAQILSEREGQVIAFREFQAEAVARAKRLLGRG